MDDLTQFVLAVPTYVAALGLSRLSAHRALHWSFKVPAVWIPHDRGPQCAYEFVAWFEDINLARPSWVPSGFASEKDRTGNVNHWGGDL